MERLTERLEFSELADGRFSDKDGKRRCGRVPQKVDRAERTLRAATEVDKSIERRKEMKKRVANKIARTGLTIVCR